MFKIFLLIILVSTCSAASFTEHKNKFHENVFFYEIFMGSDEPLQDLGRLHLLALKLLIDQRLENPIDVNHDSKKIKDLISGDQYLTTEFMRRY